MIRITDKSLCTGCTACMNICPAQCIVMRRDREGFDYPVANPDLCIGCGKCEQVCHVRNSSGVNKPLEVFAARNDAFVEGSSSGGVFPSVAGKIIEEGGVVYGAVVNEDMTVGHASAENLSMLEKMRGSKYVQSDLYGTFEEVKYELSEGRKVLFSGTPCQVAGLKSYLGKDNDLLLTVDCACHGVPSPGLWEKYVKYLEKLNCGRMTSVKFRDKTRSWMHYDFSCSFDACGKKVESHVPYIKDPYLALFVQDMILRPSCYNCPSRKGRSGSDITLADLWNVRNVLPGMNDDKGLSLLMVNTEKGRGILYDADLMLMKVEESEAVGNNGGFAEHIPVPEDRAEFFKGHHSAADLGRYMKSYVRHRPLHKTLYSGIRGVLSYLKKKITL